jgi:hypothetical protein
VAGALAAAAAVALVSAGRWGSRPPPVVTLALAPGLVRGAGHAPDVVLPAGTRLLRLTLELPAPGPSRYRGILRTAEGAVVWQAGDLTRERSRTVAAMPASLLGPADYVLTLQAGTEEVADYFFRVTAPNRR